MLGKSRRWRIFIAVTFCALYLAARGAAGADELTLSSHRALGETSRVEILLEVGGDLSLADEKDKQIHHLKTNVVGSMVYDEKLASLASDKTALRGVRQYRRCDAVIKIDKGTSKPRLRDDRRLLAVAVDDRHTTLFSPQGALSREELDLIEIPACSLLLERLLPERAVSPGDQWQHSDDLLALLLNLDAISQSEVSTTFKETTDTGVQLELAGTVQGAIDGVATEMQLKGRYKYDLEAGRITWFALLVKEKRRIGHVAPGVDVTARLQVKITPGSDCPQLADQELAEVSLEPQPERTLLEYESAQGKFRFLHDRAWHVVSEAPQNVALRLIDRGELIAQCNVSALAAAPAGKRFTLAKFQEDVQHSLANHFQRYLSASEADNAAGQHICRVVAAGVVEQLPIQWNYYLVADAQGRQVVLAFTMEADLVERFGSNGESMLATVRFAEPAVESAAEPTVAPLRR